MSYPNVVVDLKAKECSCYQWQVRGLPWVHAVAVIRRKYPTIYSIVEEHFFTNTYRACYSFDIHAIPQSFNLQRKTVTKNPTSNNQSATKTNKGQKETIVR
ncbi:hypothetical protein OROHE_007327 [Orobanche hederae]